MKPENDVLCPTTNLMLALAHRDLEHSKKSLIHRVVKHDEDIKTLAGNVKIIKNEQDKLKQEICHFYKLVEENENKRERTKQKILKGEKIQSKIAEKIFQCKEEIQDLEKAEKALSKSVGNLSVYEEFLKDVLRHSEFSQILDILHKYEALNDAANTLKSHQRNTIHSMEEYYGEIMNLLEVKGNKLIALFEQLSTLRTKYEKVKKSLLANEEKMNIIYDSAKEQQKNVQEVKGNKLIALFEQLSTLRTKYEKVKKSLLANEEKMNIIYDSAKEQQKNVQEVSKAAYNLWSQICADSNKLRDKNNNAKFTIIKNHLTRLSKIVNIVETCMKKAEETDGMVDVRAIVAKHLM